MTRESNKIDLSEPAVEARLQRVVLLNRLCASLAEAGRALRRPKALTPLRYRSRTLAPAEKNVFSARWFCNPPTDRSASVS